MDLVNEIKKNRLDLLGVTAVEGDLQPTFKVSDLLED